MSDETEETAVPQRSLTSREKFRYWSYGTFALSWPISLFIISSGSFPSWVAYVTIGLSILGGFASLYSLVYGATEVEKDLSFALETNNHLREQNQINEVRLKQMDELTSITGQLMSDWPNLRADDDLPIARRLRSAYEHLDFETAKKRGKASSNAKTELKLVQRFVGRNDKEKMWAEEIDTEAIADIERDGDYQWATDYLCVINAHEFTDFLAPKDEREFRNSGLENFYRQFWYFSKFEREKVQRDRITRVFSVPCKMPDENTPAGVFESNLSDSQVHRLFCLLWINWSAGVDTKYHCYFPGASKDRPFFETADYVISYSPSSDQDPETLFVAIPGNEGRSLKFKGTPVLRRIFTKEFYSRLSLAADGDGRKTRDFLFRYSSQILRDFRASDEDRQTSLAELLNSAVDNLCRSHLEAGDDQDRVRAKRIREEFHRWFPSNGKLS